MSFIAKIERTETLKILDCCVCGSPIALAEDHESRLRTDGGSFYCSRGHSQSFTTTKVGRLEKELADERRRKEEALARANRAAEDLAKAQKQLAKSKRDTKRLEQGVCPCCTRSFAAGRLARHIKTKHPEWKA